VKVSEPDLRPAIRSKIIELLPRKQHAMSLSGLDWLIVVIYLAVIAAVGLFSAIISFGSPMVLAGQGCGI